LPASHIEEADRNEDCKDNQSELHWISFIGGPAGRLLANG
jgi:hypothetical protein